MAQKHTTFESLLGEINKRVNKQLSGPVAKRVETQLHKNAKTMATGKYSRSSGGIGDRNNIVSEVTQNGNTTELFVKNIARPQDSVFGTLISNEDDTLFSKWANEGSWMNLNEYLSTGTKTKRDARPFIDETQKDINGSLKNQIIKDIEKGLK